ncbi:unnamed protein product [Ectocarpus fasciculatus]
MTELNTTRKALPIRSQLPGLLWACQSVQSAHHTCSIQSTTLHAYTPTRHTGTPCCSQKCLCFSLFPISPFVRGFPTIECPHTRGHPLTPRGGSDIRGSSVTPSSYNGATTVLTEN